jgi:hypothetical protein
MLGTLARRFANLAFGGSCYLCRGAAGAPGVPQQPYWGRHQQ